MSKTLDDPIVEQGIKPVDDLDELSELYPDPDGDPDGLMNHVTHEREKTDGTHEYHRLLSEISGIDDLLESLPEFSVIERMGLERRREMLTEQVNRLVPALPTGTFLFILDAPLDIPRSKT